MRLLHKTIASTAIATTAFLGGLSAITQAATLTNSISFDREEPIAKVGGDLASLYTAYESALQKADGVTFQLPDSLLQLHNNHVAINAVASGSTNALLKNLEQLGLHKTSTRGSIVSGMLPIEAIDNMANLNSLQFARPAYQPLANVGLTTSQGDIAMKADVARSIFNVDGTGVTVGVLSNSFDNLGGAAADVASGDLPSGINVLKDLPSGGNDEGRATMQVIHDVAPGANLAFHTAFVSEADFANGILRLANEAGANVIVDNVIYFAEPMFQDGIIAQAVDSVVAQGVSYFSSAGNYGRDAYESAFNPSGLSDPILRGELHDFDPGSGVDVLQSITVPEGTRFRISFQWDSPFFSVSPGSGGSPNDLNVLLFDSTGTNVLSFSADNNIGADAIEVFTFVNDGSFGTDQFNLAISHSAGPYANLMKYVALTFLGTINEFNTDSGALYGHPNAAGAEAVVAAPYYLTPEFGTSPAVLDPFSSAGSTPILFDTSGNRLANPEIRLKPDIVAPTGVNTTFFFAGVDPDNDGLPNFFGTSAAAPHAAAVAALMLQAAPDTSPSKIYSLLESTALDMRTLGFDFDSGYGFIQADRAVAALVSPSVTPIPEPTSVLGVLAFSLLSAGLLQKRNSNKNLFVAKIGDG
ncbi:peptidase S8 [Scytonema hofmannii PCC 7110]|uniref:Peptidase S8 n=1 Tax=Scytonema hofmannii PCC 7110 TaxID=128403 RepID=A0A139X7K3_9CYAN|nr:S8 family serine peptidase [Scytonema hofmannii]KYC40660.1 peptidase S8 [Scytonema hofmannii PCC 7110]